MVGSKIFLQDSISLKYESTYTLFIEPGITLLPSLFMIFPDLMIFEHKKKYSLKSMVQ